MARPKLIVFDLDYTLWPFWVDCHVTPPFTLREGQVYDRRGDVVNHYRDVPEILQALHSDGYKLAIASRTGETEGANQLVQLFGWDQYFSYREIYPGRKTTHFQKFQEASGLPYSNMLFFDDEMRNIWDINSIGATAIFVDGEMTMKLVRDGIEEFAKRNK